MGQNICAKYPPASPGRGRGLGLGGLSGLVGSSLVATSVGRSGSGWLLIDAFGFRSIGYGTLFRRAFRWAFVILACSSHSVISCWLRYKLSCSCVAVVSIFDFVDSKLSSVISQENRQGASETGDELFSLPDMMGNSLFVTGARMRRRGGIDRDNGRIGGCLLLGERRDKRWR